MMAGISRGCGKVPLNLMYITNRSDVAEIAQKYGVDRIWVDLETRGKEERQKNYDSVKSQHTVADIKAIKPWVKVSSSPIGKYDDTNRYPSRGWNALNAVYQDAQQWLREGIHDALFPMMYFKDNQFYPFALDWEEMFKICIDPEKARAYYESTPVSERHTCSMCGKMCAVRTTNMILNGEKVEFCSEK